MKKKVNIAVVGLGQIGIYLLNELNTKITPAGQINSDFLLLSSDTSHAHILVLELLGEEGAGLGREFFKGKNNRGTKAFEQIGLTCTFSASGVKVKNYFDVRLIQPGWSAGNDIT